MLSGKTHGVSRVLGFPSKIGLNQTDKPTDRVYLNKDFKIMFENLNKLRIFFPIFLMIHYFSF